MNQTERAYPKAFGDRICALRKLRALSQEQLADICHLDRTYIDGIERGERDTTVLKVRVIAEALSVKVAEVFV